jgi:hypothetical protein
VRYIQTKFKTKNGNIGYSNGDRTLAFSQYAVIAGFVGVRGNAVTLQTALLTFSSQSIGKGIFIDEPFGHCTFYA